MPSTFVATRTQVILGLCVPLAVLIGFFLAEPFQLGNITLLAFVGLVLTFPLVIRWHHPLLVLSWNAAITPSFLPGRPHLWILMAGLSFMVAILNRAVSTRHPFRHVSIVTSPLLALLGVVLLTAAVTGGLGVAALGSESYGGKGYFYIIAAVIGYFALCNEEVGPKRRQLYIAMFFLSGLSYLLSNIAYSAGRSFWWMYYFLPGKYAIEQAVSDASVGYSIARVTSLYPASMALYAWVLVRYGIRGIFVWQQPWRMALFCVAWAACICSGFRSALVLFGLLTLFQFWFEGLHRTRFLAIAAGVATLSLGMVIGFSDRMPDVVQRTISFLPVRIDPVIRSNAEASTEWRLQMWRELLPEVPRYLLKGKGYALDPNQFNMAIETATRERGAGYHLAASVGDYHSGPLSIIIPFGIWGVLAFAWFLGASIYYLYGNYRDGDPGLRQLNTLLLSLFLARTVFFLLVFGAFSSSMAVFTGIVGFAVAMNPRRNPRAKSNERTTDDRDPQRVRDGQTADRVASVMRKPL